MNYEIIKNEIVLAKFIAWLPELEEGECYYLALFARKKYHASAKNDKSQCKRATATSKTWLFKKIQQMEIPLDKYTNKDGTAVHNDALVLYVTVNPRSFALAQRLLLKKLADTVANNSRSMNPASMAMSCIQKAKSRTSYVDFDFDGVNFCELYDTIANVVNMDACTVLNTRGGFHLLVDPVKVNDRFTCNWYKKLSSLPSCDVSGDNLIPVAGCTQGGFMPMLEDILN